jgi:hypothetical protein
MRVSIKQGSIVWMDFSSWRWPDLPGTRGVPQIDPFMLFECTDMGKNNRVALRAYGFGEMGSADGLGYGNGSISASKSDIIDWSKI